VRNEKLLSQQMFLSKAGVPLEGMSVKVLEERIMPISFKKKYNELFVTGTESKLRNISGRIEMRIYYAAANYTNI
jgi:hypothetical protein